MSYAHAIPVEPAALARAFLALVEADDEPVPARRSIPRVAVALLATVVIAVTLPLLWASVATHLRTDDASAMVPQKTSLVAQAADDDEPAAGR